jgi:hypothetical protein
MATENPLRYSPDAMVVFIQRGREACEKLRYHGAVIGDSNKRLSKLKRTFGEQDWATIDTDRMHARINALDSGLVTALALVSKHLSAAAPSQQLPDAFGYALATLANESFNALLAADDALFATLFPTYLVLALKGYDRVNEELAERDLRTRLLYGSDLLLEAAEISGYAYLVSGSSRSTAKDAVERAWSDTLSRLDAKRLVQLLLMVETFREATLMSLMPRDILRTGWRQRFGREMVKAGFMNEEFTHSWDDAYSIGVMPIDPMVHAFFRNGVHFGSSRDIFYLAFLAKRPEIGATPLPRGAVRLADSTQRLMDFREEARKGFGPLSENPRGPFASPGGRRRRSQRPPVNMSSSPSTPVETTTDEQAQSPPGTVETPRSASTLEETQQAEETHIQEVPPTKEEPDA